MGVGTWGTTTTADGHIAGALALPAVDASALHRVVDVVNRVRALNLSGVLPVVDLVSHGGRVWLVTKAPASPTVASLAGRLTPALAATIAAATGHTLTQLHDAGLTHGALDPSTVIIGADGAVLLNEIGISAALRGGSPGSAGSVGSAGSAGDAAGHVAHQVAADVAAWTALVRGLVPGDQILDAVATAAAAGLDTALRVLAANSATQPDVDNRSALVQLRTGAPAAPAPAADVPPESQTLLGARAASPTGQSTTPAAPSSASPQDQATRLGQRRSASAAPARASGGSELRFGPGVPARPATTPHWTTPPQARPRRGLLRRASTVLSGLLTVALVATVGLLLWQRFYHPLHVTAATVAPTTLAQCDSQADVVATVRTNGKAGSFFYEWTVHLGGSATDDTTARLEQTVNAGDTSVPVHLLWTFTGKGSVTGTATIDILSAVPILASGPIAYTCN